ncbi:hypothetical protein BDW02DRAFT_570063 [Decorospora gaudefroyi]|uniref:Uncharacterized protein n=1 Tax=Decorospora gaudefroyi TaxID=184978 RepID=A0A6A5KE52_9PLEO|nr:hypothetical protein BDW02DRAFT_570063 [Decorospora gaudefroyi]
MHQLLLVYFPQPILYLPLLHPKEAPGDVVVNFGHCWLRAWCCDDESMARTNLQSSHYVAFAAGLVMWASFLPAVHLTSVSHQCVKSCL